MIQRYRPDAFLALGDLVYPRASTENFRRYYDGGYGRLNDIVWPTPGNHDYRGDGLDDYLDYWAANAPHVPQSEYYAVRVGGWRLYSLNSEIGESEPGTAMYDWLETELRSDQTVCSMAMWHSPVYTAGKKPFDEEGMRPVYDLLVRYGVDLVLVGHDHNYQRWNVEVPYFVVGTGGKSRYALGSDPRLVYGNDQVNGALELELREADARFAFRTMDDVVIDSGGFACSRRP